MAVITRLAGALALGLALLGAAGPGEAVELHPETLGYVVDAPLVKEAARVNVTLTQTAPDHYEAVLEGDVQGLIAALTGSRKDRLTTRMQFREGALRPLVYIEEVWQRGKSRRKEYRFDYERRRLEQWRTENDGEPELRWQTDLTGPMYDPLSAYYNFRLGLLGEIKGGETITIAGIPYPKPESITIHIGPRDEGNLKVAVQIRNRVFDYHGNLVHIRFNGDLVPQEAWTRVFELGKLRGRLVSETRQEAEGPRPGRWSQTALLFEGGGQGAQIPAHSLQLSPPTP